MSERVGANALGEQFDLVQQENEAPVLVAAKAPEKMAANKYSGDPIAAGPIRVDYKAAISVGDMADLARLAELVIRYDAAFDAVLASKAAPLKVSLAERLLAGAAPSGKAPELAVRLLQSAADEGLDYAASRLAFLTLHGLGTAADAGKARTLAEQAAAKTTEVSAFTRRRCSAM